MGDRIHPYIPTVGFGPFSLDRLWNLCCLVELVQKEFGMINDTIFMISIGDQGIR